MKKYKNLSSTIGIIFSLVFGLISCDPVCRPGNCKWTAPKPVFDYSLPKFYIEGLWAKEDSPEVLSINTYAHFWERYAATCPECRPCVDPPMPVVIFLPLGKNV